MQRKDVNQTTAIEKQFELKLEKYFSLLCTNF